MPWTEKDVDKHKKGLTDKQKEQWVKVANSARAKCLEDGGKTDECDASAIRQANSVVGKPKIPKVSQIRTHIDNWVRSTVWEGAEHLIAPVVILIEGVHNGVFYPASELEKYIEAWNGIPVPVAHPVNEDNLPLSCNTPDLIAERVVGRFWNARFEEGKLKGEIWLDIDKTKSLAPEVLDMLRSGRRLEVSTGLFTDEDGIEGDFGDKHYESTAYNYRPDHLALLPNGEGACNWNDGCGVPRLNKQEDKNVMDKESDSKPEGKIMQALKSIAGFMSLKSKEPSHEDIRRKLSDAVNTGTTAESSQAPASTGYKFITDVYDDHFIFEQDEGGLSKLFRQGYSKNDDGEITLKDKIEEVRLETKYVTAAKKSQEESKMDKVKEYVTGLIANERTQFCEDDRDWLEKMEMAQLEKLAPKDPPEKPAVNTIEGKPDVKPDQKPDEKPDEKPDQKPTVNADEKKKPLTADEYVAEAPDEIKEVLSRSLKRDREVKAEVIKGLIANKRNKFTEDQLKAKGLDELEALASLAQVEVDYTGKGGPPVDNVTEGSSEAPPMPEMTWQ